MRPVARRRPTGAMPAGSRPVPAGRVGERGEDFVAVGQGGGGAHDLDARGEGSHAFGLAETIELAANALLWLAVASRGQGLLQHADRVLVLALGVEAPGLEDAEVGAQCACLGPLCRVRAGGEVSDDDLLGTRPESRNAPGAGPGRRPPRRRRGPARGPWKGARFPCCIRCPTRRRRTAQRHESEHVLRGEAQRLVEELAGPGEIGRGDGRGGGRSDWCEPPREATGRTAPACPDRMVRAAAPARRATWTRWRCRAGPVPRREGSWRGPSPG